MPRKGSRTGTFRISRAALSELAVLDREAEDAQTAMLEQLEALKSACTPDADAGAHRISRLAAMVERAMAEVERFFAAQEKRRTFLSNRVKLQSDSP